MLALIIVRINGYEHYSGNANAATVSSITLAY
jgi:hypothetical protein